MIIPTEKLNDLWQSAKNLKSCHELIKFIDNLPNSKNKERLRQLTIDMLNQTESTGTNTKSVPVANALSFNTVRVDEKRSGYVLGIDTYLDPYGEERLVRNNRRIIRHNDGSVEFHRD